MQIRGARPVTLPAKGSRMAALGISLGGGKKGERKGGLSKPEIRSSVTHLRRIRHVTRWNIITDTRKNARHPRFWSFETLSDCVEN